MTHLFSSGEILNHQNEKSLPEGHFAGDTLEYDVPAPDTLYACHGVIDGREVTIRFRLDEASSQHVLFRKMLGILMQSDVFEGVWTEYEIVPR